SAREQYMFELINRMRADPTHELQRILSANDPSVNGALNFFKVNRAVLAQQFSHLTPVEPLAWNDSLYQSALTHDQRMRHAGIECHQLPGEPPLNVRVSNVGYTEWSDLTENVFAFARNILYGHAAFAIDWGGANSTGIQSPPSHRQNIMDPSFREIGIGVV